MWDGMENETRGNEGLRRRHCNRLYSGRSTKSGELARGQRTIVLPSDYRLVFLHCRDEHSRLVGRVLYAGNLEERRGRPKESIVFSPTPWLMTAPQQETKWSKPSEWVWHWKNLPEERHRLV